MNYDCDLEGANLFERLVLAMVRIAQGSQDKDVQAAAGPEETALRLTVCILPSPSAEAKCCQDLADGMPASIPQSSISVFYLLKIQATSFLNEKQTCGNFMEESWQDSRQRFVRFVEVREATEFNYC